MRARKRFGQHFLEPQWIRKLVDVIRPAPGDRFLEIGPGRGALTRPLAEAGARVLAIEIDRDLAAALAGSRLPGVSVVTADVLRVDLPALVAETWGAAQPASLRVAGNLPYNVSSPILFHLLDLQADRGLLADATLMLQLEVADRLAASPGSRDYGVLAVFAQWQAEVTRPLVLPSGAFRPVPRVRSAVIRLRFRPPPVPLTDRALFRSLVRTLFTRRRKTVLNALKPFAAARSIAAPVALAAAGLDPARRPETLQLVELARLAEIFASAPG